jgi:hypothetical protein
MSRFYEMSVEISGHDPAKATEIRAAAEEEWPFDDWRGCPWDESQGTAMHASAQHQLCGGESEEQFTERLSVAIWRANDGFCEVVVNATYLEELPYEIHSLDQADYERLIQGKHRSTRRRKSK